MEGSNAVAGVLCRFNLTGRMENFDHECEDFDLDVMAFRLNGQMAHFIGKNDRRSLAGIERHASNGSLAFRMIDELFGERSVL